MFRSYRSLKATSVVLFGSMLTLCGSGTPDGSNAWADAHAAQLTAIRSMGEVLLRKGGDVETHRSTVASILEESDRLRSLVDDLLSLTRAEAGELDRGAAIIEVGDDGPGIPDSVRERIFERGSTGGVGAEEEIGTGLGLAVVRWIAELH